MATSHRSHSSITRLPKPLAKELDRLIGAGVTYVQIADHMKGLGATISKSAIGRHAQKLSKLSERMATAKAFATSLGGEWKDMDGSNMRAIVEALTAFITELLLNADEQGLSPAAIKTLSGAMEDLASVQKLAISNELQSRKVIASNIEQQAPELGLPSDKVEALKRLVLGVKAP